MHRHPYAFDGSGMRAQQGEQVWSNDKVRVTAGNVSLSTADLPAAARHVQVLKRRVG